MPASNIHFASSISELLCYFLIFLFVHIIQFLSLSLLSLISSFISSWSPCILEFDGVHKVDSVNLLLLHFKKLVFKWCLSTLNYPIFLVPLGWKIFFVAPCYYLSLSENLDLVASHLLRSTRLHYSQPPFYLPGEKPFSRPHLEGQIKCTVYKTEPTWGMGEKSPSPGKAVTWSPSRCWREWPQLSSAF